MIYHSGIFYPSDKTELEKLIGKRDGTGEAAKAYILPHMDLRRCISLYKSVFSSIEDGVRIVALLPLHRAPLMKDKDTLLFSSGARVEQFITGDITILDGGMSSADSYEKEEASLELLFPLIAAYCPSSPLIAIFSAISKADEVKAFSRTIASMDDGKTVFIISSNMTGKCEDPIAERELMIERLEAGEPLLDGYRKGKLTACGIPLIEALSRAIPGSWKLIGSVEDDRAAGHAALLRKQYGDKDDSKRWS